MSPPQTAECQQIQLIITHKYPHVHDGFTPLFSYFLVVSLVKFFYPLMWLDTVASVFLQYIHLVIHYAQRGGKYFTFLLTRRKAGASYRSLCLLSPTPTFYPLLEMEQVCLTLSPAFDPLCCGAKGPVYNTMSFSFTTFQPQR